MIVFESFADFLNEDLGNLKPFGDLPNEWRNLLLAPLTFGGRESVVEELPLDADYKIWLKKLKDDNLIFCIIKVDGKSRFMIKKISPNKFEVKDAKGEYSVKRKIQDEEKRTRDAERLARESKTNESTNPLKVSKINERRYHYYDSALVGQMSVPDLQKWLEKEKNQHPESTYQAFLIFKDVNRAKKKSERWTRKNSNDDPLKSDDGYYKKSDKQRDRYEIYAEKKRAELDRQIDKVLDDFKQQLIDNFDKSIEKVVDDMRKGYSWNVDIKTIGEALLKGIDMAELKRFTQAYDAIEPSGDYDSIKSAKKLKDLGF